MVWGNECISVAAGATTLGSMWFYPRAAGQAELVPQGWDILPSVLAWAHREGTSVGQNATGVWQGRDGQGHLS